ncbi:MAG: helix-turn-helix transcriptional regulator [Lachnospiraceae bacterium]|nr:helix-turn-helix transcriptional regulator [Lachnospiraceae bacterium]
MVEETFGKRIFRLRKQVNMTQRELATKLGVSEPAVCKWETDSSMPDIMLLMPLARALHTDLNTLFLFEDTLSKEKVKAIADCAEKTEWAGGITAELAYWRERMWEYPNSELLKLTYAKRLTKLHMQQGLAEEQVLEMERILLGLLKSEELEIKAEAQHYLASFYIRNQRFEEAKNAISIFPSSDFNARHFHTVLLYEQKEYEACEKAAEQFLLECVQNVLICLSHLNGLAVTMGDMDKERIYAETICCIEELFGLPFYRGAIQMVCSYLRVQEEEKAAECFEVYVEKMIRAEEKLRESKFFGGLGEEIRFISNGTLVTLEEFREELYRVMQNPAYMKNLRGNVRFAQSMEKLNLYMADKTY